VTRFYQLNPAVTEVCPSPDTYRRTEEPNEDNIIQHVF